MYQKALDNLKDISCDEANDCKNCNLTNYCGRYQWVKTLQELVDKATPKKLKSKTDKDGRLLWVCPNCGDVYMKFWSDVETISCRKYCDECGQKLDWSDEDE